MNSRAGSGRLRVLVREEAREESRWFDALSNSAAAAGSFFQVAHETELQAQQAKVQEVEAQAATLKQEAKSLATVIAGLQEQIAVLNASLQEREAAQGTGTPASLVTCAIHSLDLRLVPTLVYLACP